MENYIIVGILIPFVGTLLGAASVCFLKGKINPLVQKGLLGFASGVMVAAAVWSLLIPALDMSEHLEKLSFVPAVVGFAFGILFLLLMDKIVPHLHMDSKEPEGLKSTLKKNTMLVLAVTLHNIPEGMAVGVVFAGLMTKSSNITIAGAFALSIGIAIQNFPEGAIISLPLRSEGMTRRKAFRYGMLSGIVEPIGAVITLMLTRIVVPVLPYLLAFAAGAMIYVVVEEVIPETQQDKYTDIATLGFIAGFIVMMLLDVGLG